MILHCPGCMVKLRLPDSYLEGGKEVWVRCPKCGERFRPQRPDLAGELGLSAPPQSRSPSPDRQRQVADILNRIDYGALGGRRRETDIGQALDALPVIPEVPKKTWVFLGLTCLLVAALLVAIGWVFHSAAAPPPPATAAAAAPPPDYGRDLLLPDLLSIQRDLLRVRHIDRRIDYRGSESRFYKYYVPILAPDLCQEITALRLWSSRTSEGFTLVGECLNPRQSPAAIEVRWDYNTARISIQGRPQTVDLPLPQTGPSNLPGASAPPQTPEGQAAPQTPEGQAAAGGARA
ncbi:MAG: zinc-ribbon domain-containing protein [Deltaproteobacteria bacterium]|jgi:hypothetical protein|nr:zinc-ribbon domain-containing protein [Deltaproteobacteria bacterium]